MRYGSGVQERKGENSISAPGQCRPGTRDRISKGTEVLRSSGSEGKDFTWCATTNGLASEINTAAAVMNRNDDQLQGSAESTQYDSATVLHTAVRIPLVTSLCSFGFVVGLGD